MDVRPWVAMLAPYRMAIFIGGGVVVAVLLAWLVFSGPSACGSLDEAKEKAGKLAAEAQAAAQQGKISIPQLANITRAVNAASDAFTASKDRAAYCRALDRTREGLKL